MFCLLYSDTTCQGVVEGLEGIDDEVDEIGIAFVKTRNEDYPYRTHDISSFPVLGLYRNGGEFIQYEGRCIWKQIHQNCQHNSELGSHYSDMSMKLS